jgi:hypothetical protein
LLRAKRSRQRAAAVLIFVFDGRSEMIESEEVLVAGANWRQFGRSEA